MIIYPRISRATLHFSVAMTLSVIGYSLDALNMLPWVAYMVLIAAFCIIVFLDKKRFQTALPVWIGFVILMAVPVSTEVSVMHVFIVLSGIIGSILIPHVISRVFYKQSFLHTTLDFQRRWTWQDIGYVILPAVSTAICTGYYFMMTNAAHGWHLDTTINVLVTFFFVMLVGVWEEFFFIAFVFVSLRRFLPFAVANALQTIAFSVFLYQVGFRGLIVPLIIAYAAYQGYIYHKRGNLLLNVSIHIIVDLIMFAWMLYSVRPDIFHIYILKA